MRDLPALATVTASYRLLVREFPTIVRLSWATFFIVALIQYFLARNVLAQMATALARQDVVAAAAISRAPHWLALKMAADTIGTAIVAVTLHELVLFGDRKPGHYFHLAFGWREGVFAALGVGFLAVVVLFAVVVISPFGEATAGLAPFFATLLLVVAIYVYMRLWVLPPMIVVEDGVDFVAAWQLTRGRFWTLLAVLVLTFMPIGILAVAIDFVLPASDTLMDAITGSQEKVPPLSRAVRAVAHAQRWLPLRILFDFVLIIISTGVTVALMSYSYLALTGRSIETPLRPKE
jgi:hypothetical protein